MRYVIPVALTLLVLAGCAAPPPAPLAGPAPIIAPAPRPVPAPAPLANDWNDWPFTPGEWKYVKRDGLSSAIFESEGRFRLSLTCRSPGQIELARVPAGLPITIRTTSTTRIVNPSSSKGEPPVALVGLTASDPLLDAIAFSRGRFVIEQAGEAPLVLPPYAEIGRVIEDCRG